MIRSCRWFVGLCLELWLCALTETVVAFLPPPLLLLTSGKTGSGRHGRKSSVSVPWRPRSSPLFAARNDEFASDVEQSGGRTDTARSTDETPNQGRQYPSTRPQPQRNQQQQPQQQQLQQRGNRNSNRQFGSSDNNNSSRNQWTNSRHRSSSSKSGGRTGTSSPPPPTVSNSHRSLNQALVQADSASAVLQLLQQHATLQHTGAGQSLNSVNFSTALHRLARHATTFAGSSNQQQQQQQQHQQSDTANSRARTLSDPRTALLLTSIAETIAHNPSTFQARELANMAWALAKLKLAPPLSALPHVSTTISTNGALSTDTLLQAATTVRQLVMDVARERATQSSLSSSSSGAAGGASAAHRWIPALSQLSGYLLDVMGETVYLRAVAATTSSQSTKLSSTQLFQMQEWSNLLWAWSTAGRANDAVFAAVIRHMIQQQSEQLHQRRGSTDSSPNGSSRNDDKPLLRPQEWSNAIWAVATAQCDSEQVVELLAYVAQLMEQHDDFINAFKSQELSNTVWGVATILANKKQQQSTLNGVSTTALLDLEQQSALTILRYCLQAVVQRNAMGFRTQELSNTAWAAATLGFGLASTMTNATAALMELKQHHRLNNYIVLHSEQPGADAKLMVQAINVIGAAAIQQLPRFWSQELNNLAWALARLLSDESNANVMASSTDSSRANIRTLLKGIGLQLADARRIVKSQDIGTTLWALATLEYRDESMYRAISRRLTPNDAHLYKPQELSNSVWAFATTEVNVEDVDVFDTSLVPGLNVPSRPNDPVTMCFAISAQELMKRPQQFKAQEIKDVLWAFSKVGIRHPALFKSVAEHLVGDDADASSRPRGLDEFSPQGLGNMAWSYARQAQLAESTSERLNLNIGNGRLVVYKTIFFDIGEQLLQRLFGAIAETNLRVHDELRKAKPQDISNAAWAYATLGLKASRYMEAAKEALLERTDRFVRGEKNLMTSFKGQELANLLWALATLNLSPGKTLEALTPYLRGSCEDSTGKVTALSISKQFKRQELANMAWACAVYGSYPEDLMTFLYTGLLGAPDEQNDLTYMHTIHKDSGLQMQAVMTLVYVQAEMNLRGCCQHLSLPDNFPDGWTRSKIDHSTLDDHLTDHSLELNLSTSKIQRAVSAAFSRIGFDHVEEYTISMLEMSQDYGVRVPAKQMEILSIDIANIEDKIAIEVDGPAHYVSCIDNYGTRARKSEPSGYSKIVNGKLEYQFAWTGEQQEMNGPTALKQRLLKSFGWKVIHLPFWEWYALAGDASAEDKYCTDLLDSVR